MICFIDFETTGINLYKDYPIELGAVLVNESLEVIDKFHSYIKPSNNFNISEQANKIHGISLEKLVSSPSESMVLNQINLQLGSNYRLAAWNMSFDVAFFKMLCYRNNYEDFLNKINYRHIDVQSISFIAKTIGIIDNKINSLSDFSSLLGISRSKKHSALEDAQILVDVYKFLVDRFTSSIKENV